MVCNLSNFEGLIKKPHVELGKILVVGFITTLKKVGEIT